MLRKDREKNTGGVIAYLVHTSVSFRPLDIRADSKDDHLEIQGIAVCSGEVEIEMFNIYQSIALQSVILPIIIKVDKSADFIMSEERTFINFKKADWARFRDLCEAQFCQLPTPENIHGRKSFQWHHFASCETLHTCGAYRQNTSQLPARSLPAVRNRINPRRNEKPTLTFENGSMPLDFEFVEHLIIPERNRGVVQRQIRSLKIFPENKVVFTPEEETKFLGHLCLR